MSSQVKQVEQVPEVVEAQSFQLVADLATSSSNQSLDQVAEHSEVPISMLPNRLMAEVPGLVELDPSVCVNHLIEEV